MLWLSILFTSVLALQTPPQVTLPWGIAQANPVPTDTNNNIVAFKNIRFGQAPTGTLRFQRPQIPTSATTVLPSTQAPMCIQARASAIQCLSQTTTSTTTKSSCSTAPTQIPESEDCLFFDVYVPQTVLESAQKNKTAVTPVVVWIFGGAYVFGAKDQFGSQLPLYNATGIMMAAQKYLGESFIFVTGNYRVGAFGWLAGPTMEKKATANAGLYDQRLLLQIVNKHIHLFGGDNGTVSVWGESAGGGSIMHQIAGNWDRKGFNQQNLFQHAFLQSPAFQWQYDRRPGGTLDQTFNQFASAAKCTGNADQVFKCLTKADTSLLKTANQDILDSARKKGLFPVGPAVDDGLISELPVLAYKDGKFSNGLSSIAVSHVEHEAFLFKPKCVVDEKTFDQFINDFLPQENLSTVIENIKLQYPAKLGQSQKYRADAIIRDSTFVCNTRQMFDAFHPINTTDVYMMNYGFGALGGLFALHATDLLPTFANQDFDLAKVLSNQCIPQWEIDLILNAYQNFPEMTRQYQAYLAGMALGGDPNLLSESKVLDFDWTDWQTAQLTGNFCHLRRNNTCVKDVMKVNTNNGINPMFENDAVDSQNTQHVCDFWYDIAQQIWTILYPSGKLMPAQNAEQYVMNEL